MNYEKILRIAAGCETIEYGIIFGNERVVFIKSGAFGSIKGYQDKYLRMAHRIHTKIGATVICSSNPDLTESTQLKADKALIAKVVADRGFENYEMYFVGTSDGGYHSLLLSQQISETVKYLGINSSHKGLDDFAERIQSLPHIEKIFVCGTEDEDYNSIVPTLNSLDCDNLKIVSLEGADHEFTGKIDDFILLIDLICKKQ